MPSYIHTDDNNDREVCYRSSSVDETNRLAFKLAEYLQPGIVIALIGDLGAGKTRFVKGLAAAFDVPEDEVNSPTFALIQEYAGRVTIRHCDTYRLRHPEEFLELGLDELFAHDSIALIEWADRVTHFLPRDRLTISIEIVSPEERVFRINASGRRSQSVVAEMKTNSRGVIRDI